MGVINAEYMGAATAMTKGALAETLAAATELKKAQCAKILNELAGVAATEVKKTGVFAIPGLARLKLRTKPATKASKEDCQGLPSCCFEAVHLRCERWMSSFRAAFKIVDRRVSCGTIVPIVFVCQWA